MGVDVSFVILLFKILNILSKTLLILMHNLENLSFKTKQINLNRSRVTLDQITKHYLYCLENIKYKILYCWVKIIFLLMLHCNVIVWGWIKVKSVKYNSIIVVVHCRNYFGSAGNFPFQFPSLYPWLVYFVLHSSFSQMNQFSIKQIFAANTCGKISAHL